MHNDLEFGILKNMTFIFLISLFSGLLSTASDQLCVLAVFWEIPLLFINHI